MSFNDGASWQSLRLELPVTPVHGIVIKDDDLVIGTHGRSFYVLDDINVLRQLQPEVTTASLHVFTPGAGAAGACSRRAPIDYYLKDAAEKVTIEILDGGGKVCAEVQRAIRRRRKKSRRRARRVRPVLVSRRWRGAATRPVGETKVRKKAAAAAARQRVTTKAGMNRLRGGNASRTGARFPGADHVGRAESRADRAAWGVSGEGDGRRRHAGWGRW